MRWLAGFIYRGDGNQRASVVCHQFVTLTVASVSVAVSQYISS